jgi:hypothetical protein
MFPIKPMQYLLFRLHFQSAFRQLNPNAWVDVHTFKFERAEGIAEDTDG